MGVTLGASQIGGGVSVGWARRVRTAELLRKGGCTRATLRPCLRERRRRVDRSVVSRRRPIARLTSPAGPRPRRPSGSTTPNFEPLCPPTLSLLISVQHRCVHCATARHWQRTSLRRALTGLTLSSLAGRAMHSVHRPTHARSGPHRSNKDCELQRSNPDMRVAASHAQRWPRTDVSKVRRPRRAVRKQAWRRCGAAPIGH